MAYEINMGEKLRRELHGRKMSHNQFAELVSPHLDFLKGRTGPARYVSKQWIGEVCKSTGWKVANLIAISKALDVEPSYWLEPIYRRPDKVHKHSKRTHAAV
jgi:hypothetical protein